MKKPGKIILALIGLLLVVSLMAVGCGSKTASDEKVLTVGVDLPLTGPSARSGEEFQNSCKMAFEEIGYKIGDYTVKLVWINDQSDPQVATSAYEQAVQKDKIDVSILGWNSSTTVAIMEPVAKYKIPHIFTSGATHLVDEKWHSDDKYKYYMVKGWAIPEQLSVAYVDAINEFIADGKWTPRNKKIFFLSEDTDWGRSFSTKMSVLFAEAGWTVVGEEYVKPGDTDLYAVLTKIKNSDASLYGGTFYSVPSQTALIKQSRELDIQAMLIVDALNSSSDWYSLVGDSSNFVLDSAPVYRDTETAKNFLANYKAKYGYEPSSTSGGLQYDYSRFFIKIMNECLAANGKLDSETIYNFVAENLWTGKLNFTDGVVMEEYVYSAESLPNPVVGEGKFVFPVVQWMDGKMNVVWPSSQKTADIQIPEYAK
jgi:branched-chain amino acid transport system substrate-binding protein